MLSILADYEQSEQTLWFRNYKDNPLGVESTISSLSDLEFNLAKQL